MHSYLEVNSKYLYSEIVPGQPKVKVLTVRECSLLNPDQARELYNYTKRELREQYNYDQRRVLRGELYYGVRLSDINSKWDIYRALHEYLGDNRDLMCTAWLYVTGYTQAEIATKRHLSRQTINNHISRARQAIAKVLGYNPMGDGEGK